MDKGLSATLLLEIFNFLGPGEQTRLFAVRRIEIDTVPADGVALRHQDPLTRLQAVAPRQGLGQVGRGETALQPALQQRFEPGVVQAQKFTQAWQRGRATGRRPGGQGVEGELGRWRVTGQRSDHLQAADLEGVEALAQGRLKRVFPARFNMQAAPQTLQALHAMLGQPGLQLAIGLHPFLQRLQGFEPG